ncbi:glycosyltransferase family 4 protein [Microbacterium sp. X-17]|uniref:glycosyltransferase family 4 protein n=1 Tax=Microbacterium sp. X-17 TaxID=3144404 RepID=UPI0031F5A991
MRVIHLTNKMSNLADGVVNVVVDLSTAQAAAGDDVVVASTGGDYEPLLRERGVRTARVDFTDRGPRGLWRARRRLRRLIEEFRPEVIHSHTMTPALLVSTLRTRGALTVGTVHSGHQRESRLLGVCDVVVCVSGAVERSMAESALCRGKTTVVYSGVVGTPRRSGPVVTPKLQGRSVVAVGSLKRIKGTDVLLRAFAKVAAELPDAHLYFVGNVDEEELLRPFRSEQWFGRVHLEGFHPDPTGYLLAADVFVQASRREALGLAILEALHAGIPVIGSDSEGIPEALQHGLLGDLFPSEDDVALAGLLLSRLSEPRDRTDASESGGRRDFSVARMAADYDGVYRRALSRRSSTPAS